MRLNLIGLLVYCLITESAFGEPFQLANRLLGQDKQIDRAAIEGVEKLGGQFVRLQIEEGTLVISKDGLPSFFFRMKPKERLPDLGIPFGLSFIQLGDFGDNDMKLLLGLRNLHFLSLESTQITDGGMKDLSGLNNLTFLDLAYTKITDSGLSQLKRLNSLKELNLQWTGVTGTGFKDLSGLPKLAVLYLPDGTTDEGLRDVATVEGLTSLHIWGQSITDMGTKEIARLKNLSTLVMYKTRTTDEGLKSLRGLSKLVVFEATFSELTDASLPFISNFTNLSVLRLRFAKRITGKTFGDLLQLKQLSELDLWGTGVTDEGVRQLAGHSKITSVDLSYTKVTDNCVRELKTFGKLAKLSLIGVPITDGAVADLAQMKSLLHLNLGETKITKKGRDALRKALPNCTIDF